MANFLGGDVTALVCKHEVLGEFRYQVKSNESFNLDTGGFRTADDANMITGAGEIIQQKNRIRWMLEGPIATDFISNNELDTLTELAAHPILGDWTITHISGAVYTGRGVVVGDIQADSNAATLTLKVAGSGRLRKIA